MDYQQAALEAVGLLERLIATPSVSRDEKVAADIIENYLRLKGAEPHRDGNNVWVLSPDFDDARPTVLLNAHIDTVKPAAGWQRDPFTPTLEGDRLYGLGSNDCGGGLVSLMQIFLMKNEECRMKNEKTEMKNEECRMKNMGNSHSSFTSEASIPHSSFFILHSSFNFVYLASCEEEVSGKNGMEHVLPLLPHIDFAIVGEPTCMQPAIAEKGLMVIDAVAYGKSGHAARNEGVNAIDIAMQDILKLNSEWQTNRLFPKTSDWLGAVKTTVTIINAGSQHNVIPDRCTYTIDVRPNECYTNEEVLAILRANLKSELTPRSTRLSSSHIALDHPIVQRCVALGLKPFGSPTLSDQALMPFPSLKLGPGDSARSHTADEFICISEIEKAIGLYNEILK